MPQDTALRDTLTSQAMINTITINAVIIFYAVAALRRAVQLKPDSPDDWRLLATKLGYVQLTEAGARAAEQER